MQGIPWALGKFHASLWHSCDISRGGLQGIPWTRGKLVRISTRVRGTLVRVRVEVWEISMEGQRGLAAVPGDRQDGS